MFLTFWKMAEIPITVHIVGASSVELDTNGNCVVLKYSFKQRFVFSYTLPEYPPTAGNCTIIIQ